jgi:prepilin-type N-terminal cleavage/methylation domain-containing protein/prepilin-type processing-associated H-X9-DG protein
MVRRAFTLLELLVVIAVIGCLLAVILPSMRYSKYQVQSVICTSNLRQLTLLLNTYAHFQTFYPPGLCDLSNCSSTPPGGYIGNPADDWMGWWWFHFLIDEQDGKTVLEKIISCPSSTIKNDSRLSPLCGNYGVNYSICKIAKLNSDEEFVGCSLKPGQMRQPAGVLLIADSGYSLLSWKAATLNPEYTFECSQRKNAFYVPGLSINPQKSIRPDLKTDAVKGRHPNRTINVGFCDGSVRKLPAETLLLTTDTPSDSPAYLIWSPLNKR